MPFKSSLGWRVLVGGLAMLVSSTSAALTMTKEGSYECPTDDDGKCPDDLKLEIIVVKGSTNVSDPSSDDAAS